MTSLKWPQSTDFNVYLHNAEIKCLTDILLLYAYSDHWNICVWREHPH